MIRRSLAALALVLLGAALPAAAAAQPAPPPPAPAAATAQPPALPPPPLAPLLRFAAPALEKPPVPIPPVDLPAAPDTLPELPAPKLVSDPAVRATAPLAGPRALACNPLGSVFGVASELLQCGRAKFSRGEFEPARADLAGAVQKSTDREIVREARYWLAETLIRLRRADSAEPHLAAVVQDDPRSELGFYAARTLGFLLLERGEAARALATFDPLLRAGAPPEMIPSARHGRALALYGLRRYTEARDEWIALLNLSLPRPVATDATFWLGETLGRLGDAPGAVARLQVFVAGGQHPLIESGLLRLAWWRRAAGEPLEAVKTYRALLSVYPQTAEAPWARAGLVLALLDIDDYAAAREEARQLESRDATNRLAGPTLLAVARWLAAKGRAAEAQALAGELLGRPLDPATRAWVLLMSAEAARHAGDAAEARSRMEVVRSAPGFPALASYAALRLAQLDLEGREPARAQVTAEGLVGDSSPAVRAAALVVAGEAAYGARAYDRAAGHYERFLADFPNAAEAPSVRLALGWTELRRGRLDGARQIWTRFADEQPKDPRGAGAMLLAAELAAQAGDAATARRLLEQLVRRFPDSEHAPLASLNRAILSIRAGQSQAALRDLQGLPARAALSAHLGRMRLARGIALLDVGRPADAQVDLRAALADGEETARLGLGRIALARRAWDEATREFLAARDAGSPAVAAGAEYGLAVVLYNQGKTEEFVKLAGPLVAGAKDPATTPYLLEALARLAADDKRWPEARTLTLRLADEFPDAEATPRALAYLGGAASRAGEWPVAREAYARLAARDPKHPALAAGELDVSEALLRTGAAPDARRRLEPLAGAAAGDPRLPRGLLLLAQAREATGDRAGALEVYARLRQDYPAAQGSTAAELGQARLLQAEGKWAEARPLLERALAQRDPAVAAEAAYQLGEGFRAAGMYQDAAELYMTAAYVSAESPWGRKALLGAGQSFAALRQRDAAEIVYRKLAGAKDAEPELVETARKELRALGAN